MRIVSSYFRRLSEIAFEPTEHVGGAWNPDEQHIAPVLGLLAHVVETEHAARRPETRLVLARASYDILGVIPMERFEVSPARLVRPGRTIELVEVTLTHGGRAAVTLRAWMLQPNDTSVISGIPLPHMPERQHLPEWSPADVWPGGAIRSIDARRESEEPGRARAWIRPRHPLLAGEEISARARMLGMVDFANGIATRVAPERALYPNVDLTASIFREPEGEWFGLDTSVSFGSDGVGLTESVLSDDGGPVGTSSQTLTVRPR
ncbi:thioesterase family protein [Microbacterium sp. ARD32]|uniref:thioesterase family protein n=1 Tax=Microbacterium sp. ARD32 TaxID=2962577 RepID=UPI0028824A26|nr:thioesterase family protein [Microbacterium sp. ARD32]MDT0156552.1 thioesterase family protein [Microbacterium sp. ARD32]